MSNKWLAVLLLVGCLVVSSSSGAPLKTDECSLPAFKADNSEAHYAKCKASLSKELSGFVKSLTSFSKTTSEVYMQEVRDIGDKTAVVRVLTEMLEEVNNNLRHNFSNVIFDQAFHAMINQVASPFRKFYPQVRIYEALCGPLNLEASQEKLKDLTGDDKLTVDYILRAKGMMSLDQDRDDLAELVRPKFSEIVA